MVLRKSIWALALVVLFAVTAAAASVDGKWKSEMQGPDGNTRTTTYTFKAEGEKLTGTISGRMGDTAISEGVVKGDDISFVVVRNFQGNEMKISYKGKVAGDEIKMTMQMGDMGERVMVAKRVKE